MLVECPKCGFSQPRDRYCASCGVDIDNYRARNPQQKRQWWTQPAYHFGAVVVVILLGTLYVVRQQQTQEITRRVEYLKGGPLYADSKIEDPRGQLEQNPTQGGDRSADSAEVAQSGNAAGSNAFEPPVPPLPPSMDENAGTLQLASNQSPGAQGGPATAPAARREDLKQPIKVRVYYALISTQLLAQLPIEHPMEFGTMRMGTLKDFKQLLPKLDIVDEAQIRIEPEANESTWLTGERVGDTFVGLQGRVAIHARDEQGLRGEIEILRSLAEDKSQTVNARVYGPAPFAANPGSVVLMSIDIPRERPPAAAMSSTVKFFRIFKMTDFMNEQRSQFVMFFSFD